MFLVVCGGALSSAVQAHKHTRPVKNEKESTTVTELAHDDRDHWMRTATDREGRLSECKTEVIELKKTVEELRSRESSASDSDDIIFHPTLGGIGYRLESAYYGSSRKKPASVKTS